MNKKSPLVIKNSNEDVSHWVNNKFVTADLRENLMNASILFLPFIGERQENEITFPSGTESIYSYFKNNINNEFIVDICIADKFYQELALHSNYKRLGKFLVKSVALPVFLSVLSSYVYDTLIKPSNESKKVYIKGTNKETPKKYLDMPEVKFTITVVDSNKITKEFNYEGSAKNVEEVTKTIQTLWDNE